MRTLTILLTAAVLFLIASACPAADSQRIGGVDISQWRGFNLLEKFTLRGNAPFVEEDFRWIAELGFNFVRLPMDYRCYTDADDWLKFKEPVLQDIDQAIAFGEKHHLHVCVNLHRAPGFCINPPEEPSNLWADEEPLEAFVAHWVMFARRYKSIPSERLSFNLLNEPTRSTREQYLKVFRRAIEAIQKEDPDRLIIVDGMNVGREPVPEFLVYRNVIQATRGYHPGTISHYKASWVKGSDQWPEPAWPAFQITGYLYGPAKADLRGPLVIQGDLPAGTEITIRLNQASQNVKVVAKADGQVVAEQTFDPQADTQDWQRVESEQRWAIHQAARELRWSAVLPAAAKEFSLENAAGDWLKFSELTLQLPGGQRRVYSTDQSWGRKQTPLQLGADGRIAPPPGVDPEAPLTEYLQPWLEISAQGASVFVGEWGCFNQTPHPVALAWMKSWLEKWKQARFGWALWNFRGSFGILDSGRQDVVYEDWHGHKLDREMLTLLQQYLKP
jgi:aryl-phospho-beta-D-glucosidase BglC (GH1 family)